MTRFLHRVISESDEYHSEVILLATSASDPASVLVRHPGTWRSGPQLTHEADMGFEYTRVGAWLSEIEVFRYRPRRALTQLLARFDMLQFVAGTAPWVLAAGGVRCPKCLWVATTNAGDRASRAGDGSLARRLWSASMRRAAERYEEKALAEAESILALSPYTLRALQPKLHGKPAALAVCGVDTDLFHPPSAKDPMQAQSGYILCVGRLSDSRKNIAMLLRAYASMLRKVDIVPSLCLVGEPLSDSLQSLVRELGIAGNIIAPGPLHGAALARIYREAALFVLSSDEEGLGIVLLEAMASGLPVVSTDCGGPSTAVVHGENGFLTTVRDERALASAMRQLIVDSDLRQRFGRTGRAIVEDRFSIAAAGEVFLDQYRRLFGNDRVVAESG